MEKLVEAIRDAEQVFFIAHVNPDGDAVGSVVAMAMGVAQLGKHAHAVLLDPVPASFAYLDAHQLIENQLPENPIPGALLVALDLADASRTGYKETVMKWSQTAQVALIDHHQSGDLETLVGDKKLHTIHTSSCCELCYSVLLALEARLTPPIATALLTGMYTDTGGFQFSSTSPTTLQIGSELMKRGAKLQTIVHHLTNQKSVESLKLLGVAMERMIVTHHGLVAISYVTYKDLEEFAATADDTNGIIGQLTVVPGVKVTILLKELAEGNIQGSLRSTEGAGQKPVSVANLAKLLGGGGHTRASGFNLAGTIVETSSPLFEIH